MPKYIDTILGTGVVLAAAGIYLTSRTKTRKRKLATNFVTRRPTRAKLNPDFIPIPPSDIYIGNPDGVACEPVSASALVTCALDGDLNFKPCYKCTEYNYQCQHFDGEITVEGGETIPANKEGEGYCLPPVDKVHSTVNYYTTRLVLVRDSTDANSYSVVADCLYSSFSQKDRYSDCNIFHNPCGEGILYNVQNDEEYVPGTDITFDPFYNGRCKVDENKYNPTWDATNGPGFVPKRVRDLNIEATEEYQISIKAPRDELLAVGFSEAFANFAATIPGDFPVVKPCMLDPITGESNGPSAGWNSELACCFCGEDGIPAIQVEDSGSTWVAAGKGKPNACLYNKPEADRLGMDVGGVNRDGTGHSYIWAKLPFEANSHKETYVLYQRPANWNIFHSNEFTNWMALTSVRAMSATIWTGETAANFDEKEFPATGAILEYGVIVWLHGESNAIKPHYQANTYNPKYGMPKYNGEDEGVKEGSRWSVSAARGYSFAALPMAYIKPKAPLPGMIFETATVPTILPNPFNYELSFELYNGGYTNRCFYQIKSLVDDNGARLTDNGYGWTYEEFPLKEDMPYLTPIPLYKEGGGETINDGPEQTARIPPIHAQEDRL